jgi:hypothetical protein
MCGQPLWLLWYVNVTCNGRPRLTCICFKFESTICTNTRNCGLSATWNDPTWLVVQGSLATVSRHKPGLEGGTHIVFTGHQRSTPRNGAAPYDMIMDRMDAAYAPGVPGHVFWGIFMQCQRCHAVTTTRRFDAHFCMLPVLPDHHTGF